MEYPNFKDYLEKKFKNDFLLMDIYARGKDGVIHIGDQQKHTDEIINSVCQADTLKDKPKIFIVETYSDDSGE